jgi:hypothetical protein
MEGRRAFHNSTNSFLEPVFPLSGGRGGILESVTLNDINDTATCCHGFVRNISPCRKRLRNFLSELYVSFYRALQYNYVMLTSKMHFLN